MKKILVLIALCISICLTSCLTDPIGASKEESVYTTEGTRVSLSVDGHFSTVWVDGHQYVRFGNGYQGGIAHAGTCPCWQEMVKQIVDSVNTAKR